MKTIHLLAWTNSRTARRTPLSQSCNRAHLSNVLHKAIRARPRQAWRLRQVAALFRKRQPCAALLCTSSCNGTLTDSLWASPKLSRAFSESSASSSPLSFASSFQLSTSSPTTRSESSSVRLPWPRRLRQPSRLRRILQWTLTQPSRWVNS